MAVTQRMAAGWLQGARICRHYQFEIKLIIIAIMCIALPTSTYAQPPDSSGFLSIDCGYTGPNYTDSELGLEWVGDGMFIKTGTPYEMPSYDWNNSLYLTSPNVGDIEAFKRFRYFPAGRRKYCYELPTIANGSYLIRATFYMNATVLQEKQPFLFTVSVNATNWFTIASGDELEIDYMSIQEGIFHSTNNRTDFCLQPLVGLAFISTLELRPLSDSVYSYFDWQLQYLNLLFRYNLGTSWDVPAVRWPDDRFDRIWSGVYPPFANELPIISSPTAPDNTSDTRADVYFVPPKVMKDAWLYKYPNNSVEVELFEDQAELNLAPGQYLFPILYAEHLNASDPTVYHVTGIMDGRTFPAFNFSTQASMRGGANFILSSNFITTELDLIPGENLADGPTMSASEVYNQYNFNFSAADLQDDAAIDALKTSFSLDDWQGDPCVPVPHNWLECSLNSPFYEPIRQPCNSNQTSVTQCVVQEGFLSSTYFVNAVNLSNLSTSGFSLLQATPNISLGSLMNISITNSGVDSQTFEYLTNNFSMAKNLLLLDFSYNVIDRVTQLKGMDSLAILNLAHNNLSSDNVNPNEVIPLPTSLQELNLSYNSITSIPESWQNTSNGLVVLDLSCNQLGGDISALDNLVQMNTNGTLQQLYVSNNRLQGTFSSSTYFSGPKNLTIADFSNNFIEGTLNLSIWYDELTRSTSGSLAASGSVNANPSTTLFSFVNNNITNIVPDAGTFGKSIQAGTLREGILLGGNPYCKGAKSYPQRYLCRSDVGETVLQGKKSNKTVIIVSVCGGVVALLLCCLVLISSWKMWQQIYELRKIQHALAERKVQPPFYQYSELKLAAGSFNKENKLGHGAFGIVYKAIFSDGTTLAVKKLFDGGRVVVLDEFLNEVVLITGIKHRNLVQLKGCCIKDKERLLVYEYAERGNLAEALWGSKAHGGLNWEQRFNICVGVARGLAYLHEELHPSIIHRDIKAANILLDKNYNPKIADFGLALHFSDTSPTISDSLDVAGTLGYLAPEYAMEGVLSEKADVYSYGILVLELVCGRKCIDLSLPIEERFLKNWACHLIKTGNLLDVLESELRDSCVSSEVIRAINIGLLCVQHREEKRPSMSNIVTMLLGDINVEGFLGESSNLTCSFDDLMTSISQDIDYPVLQKLATDSTLYHPLRLDESLATTGRPSARRLLELIELNTSHAR